MKLARCTACGRWFLVTEDWQILCVYCWVTGRRPYSYYYSWSKKFKSQAEERGNGDEPHHPQLLSKLRKYVKFLIFACHPDRNPEMEMAGEVTAWLIDVRQQLTQGEPRH